jgi:hypothetical protein
LMLHVARDYGFADVSRLSADTTAQEWLSRYIGEILYARAISPL